MAVRLLHPWNHWPIQILVLLSLTFQVVLLLLAGSRRRGTSTWKKVILWLAYQQADSAAIYTIGHLSLSATPSEHRLVAFWAPFLLLHLGGPDNISAYALQDNQLWLRHLQTLIVQVLGAAYVLYKHIIGAGRDFFLQLAALLLFTSGLVKYAERTCALKRGNFDSIGSSVKKEPLAEHQHNFHPLGKLAREKEGDRDEISLRLAHSVFHICKCAMAESWLEKKSHNRSVEMLRDLIKEAAGDYKGMWRLVEMELSLMYDVLYTKAAVAHTWHGYCIRLMSPLTAATSILLFQFSRKDGHGRVDVGITYALLAGTFLMESVSLVSALGSTWTYHCLCISPWSWLHYADLCNWGWDRLRSFLMIVKGRGGGKRSARRWSQEMGQYNMFHLCSHLDRAYKPVLGKLARLLGYKERWITYHYSGTTCITADLKERLFQYMQELSKNGRFNTRGAIRMRFGQDAVRKVELYKEFEIFLGLEFQECVLILHITTDLFLSSSTNINYNGGPTDDADDVVERVKAIRTLSNYMMFLRVERPYMLPGPAQVKLYRLTRDNLAELLKDPNTSMNVSMNVWMQLKELCRLRDDPKFAMTNRDKYTRILTLHPFGETFAPRLWHIQPLYDKLRWRETTKGVTASLDLLLDLWMDFIIYSSIRCSRESHAKKLSTGGELITILWLMAYYLHLQDHADEINDGIGEMSDSQLGSEFF